MNGNGVATVSGHMGDSLARIEGKVDVLVATTAVEKEHRVDHELRLRNLERRIYQIYGGAFVVSSVVSAVGYFIGQ